MKINILNNGKILKEKLNLDLPNFVVLTGENGSGKTQLLELLSNNHMEYIEKYNQELIVNLDITPEPIHPLIDDSGKKLLNITYSYPGLQNNQSYYYGNKPLIEQIREQWNSLKSVSKSFILLKGKKFNTEEEEINFLNIAIKDFIKDFIPNTNSYQSEPNLINISSHHLYQLKELSKKANKNIEDLTYIDFLIFYNVPTNIFSSAIDLLFHQFYLRQKYYPELTNEISTPWDVFNSILERVNFKYKVEYIPPSQEEYPMPIKLIDIERGLTNGNFDTLSSGEKTIMALIFVLYHSSNNGNFPEVILFDEPDAHLHPSFTELFISVIQKVLVDEQDVKVILTTHSPSTIALAPENSIYRMDRSLGYPIKESRNNAVQNLSNGLASIIFDEGTFGIEYSVKSTEKNVLFTEGITDKIILEIAWQKIYENAKMPFIIQECYGANFLSNLFRNGNQKQDGLFEINPDKVMIALFDFDQEGYNQWNSIKFQNNIEANPYKCLTKSNSKNAYTMLLPVPNIEEVKLQVIKKENETFKDKSLMTIEFLLFNVPNFKDKYFKLESSAGGAKMYHFKGDKREFAQNLQSLDKQYFSNFIPLFDKIKNLNSNKTC